MSMFDTGEIELILPNGNPFNMGPKNNIELQTHMACLGIHFHITNLGTQGYSKNDPFNPLSLFKNDYLQFTVSNFSDICEQDFRVYFNKFGVVYRIGFTSYDRQAKKWVDDEATTVNWPKDQIKKYNRKAILEILKLQPSRFSKEVSTWTRIRCAFHFCIYLKIIRLLSVLFKRKE